MSYFVHPTAVVDEGCELADKVKVWHFCHLMSGCSIGEGSVIGQNVFIASGVRIGKNVHIQNNVSVYEGVECEDDVFLGPSMVFTNIKNPRSAISRKGQFVKTLVRTGASIGANATIVCGTEIGPYALIGAGAVITKNVPPYALFVGNPARQNGWVSRYGHRLDFDATGRAVCPESNETYLLAEGRITRVAS